MELLKTVSQARAFSKNLHREGRRLALVPTMGFLHQGHLSLIAEGVVRADAVAVSIFVNPTQFAPSEDYSSYPRDLEGDLKKCRASGAAAVFSPQVGEFYSEDFQTQVEVTRMQMGLCGDRRPGHFRGVATVVAKLFALFQPEVALFGEKDYQQLRLLTVLNQDLNFGVEVVGMPIVREQGGLAMSSRNNYLSPSERERALSLFRGLSAARRLFEEGVRDAKALTLAVREELAVADIQDEYIHWVDANTLVPIDRLAPGRPTRLLVAASVGKTRLIDNIGLVA